jgi:hypothetical protein
MISPNYIPNISPLIVPSVVLLLKTCSLVDLIQRLPDRWEMYTLKNRRIGLCCREVTERSAVDTERLKNLDAERLEQMVAMRLFRQAAGLTRSMPASGRGGGGGRGRGRGRGGGSRSFDAHGARAVKKIQKCDETTDSESSHCDSSSTHEVEPAPRDRLDGVTPCAERSDGGGVQRKRPGAARPGERVLEHWAGCFPFSKIERGGTLVGYGVVCGLHVNANGAVANTQCKKSVTFGAANPLSEDECRKRLKRWLVAGSMDLDPECERQSHIRKGGTQLSFFDSETSTWGELDDDLDAMLEGLVND